MSEKLAATWIDGITRGDIYEFADRQKPKTIHLGDVHTAMSHEQSKAALVERLDGLLRLFGVDADTWGQNIQLSTRVRGYSEDFEHVADARRSARGEQLGNFMYDRAWMAVPIECGEEEDVSKYKLGLKLDETCNVVLQSSGTHSVVRVYVKPGSFDRVTGDINELEEKALNGELDTDIEAVHTSIYFNATFSRPNIDQ